MNMDDPKLTAFALGELNETERSTIARKILQSPDAQRYVDETRQLAAELRRGYAVEFDAGLTRRKSLIDIRDDPWFWAKARPLAIAAGIAFCAIAIAVGLAKYRINHEVAQPDSWPVDVEAGLPLPNSIPNPIAASSLQRIDHVVVAEVVDRQPGGEVRAIEVIDDAFRISKMRQELSAPTLSRNLEPGLTSQIYQLEFVDRDGAKVATAYFYRTGGGRFVLQILSPAQASAEFDFSKYALPFNNWLEAIGYAPGA